MSVLDVVAPIICAGCGTPGDDLCLDCAGRIDVLQWPWCRRCGSPSTQGGAKRRPPLDPPRKPACACADLEGFGLARSLVVFDGPARALAIALKRRGRHAVADGIGVLLADLVRREGLVGDLVTFVPGGGGRGFDHAELLARSVASHLDAPMRRTLRRTGRGPRQADVPLPLRRSNVAGRFVARPVAGDVLVVDDVFTTGATAEACARAVVDAGADRVDVVTWARTLRRTGSGRGASLY